MSTYLHACVLLLVQYHLLLCKPNLTAGQPTALMIGWRPTQFAPICLWLWLCFDNGPPKSHHFQTGCWTELPTQKVHVQFALDGPFLEFGAPPFVGGSLPRRVPLQNPGLQRGEFHERFSSVPVAGAEEWPQPAGRDGRAWLQGPRAFRRCPRHSGVSEPLPVRPWPQ